jgi:hypothetical protein
VNLFQSRQQVTGVDFGSHPERARFSHAQVIGP